MNHPHMIVLHHSATKDSGTVSWGAIRRYHVETNGWSDIGYHAGIEMVGNHYECMVGRSPEVVGAHCFGHNTDSLGFCFVGDYDTVKPTTEMLTIAVDRVLVPWCKQYKIAPEYIFGHRAFSPKTCPGRLFDVDLVKSLIKARL